MAIKTSTGLRNAMLDTGSFKSIMDGGTVKIYSGAVPADADAALGSAVLLVPITNASTATGVTMAAAAVAGVLTKTVAEVWSGVNVATGMASFYRFVTAADTGAASTTEKRVQGLCATAGSDMNMSDTTLTAAATHTQDFYSIALPSA